LGAALPDLLSVLLDGLPLAFDAGEQLPNQLQRDLAAGVELLLLELERRFPPLKPFLPAGDGLGGLRAALLGRLGDCQPGQPLDNLPLPRRCLLVPPVQIRLAFGQPKSGGSQVPIEFRRPRVKLTLTMIEFLLPGAKVGGQLGGLRAEPLGHGVARIGKLACGDISAGRGSSEIRIGLFHLWLRRLRCLADLVRRIDPHLSGGLGGLLRRLVLVTVRGRVRILFVLPVSGL
jgi:hypothetical protein